MFPIQCEEVQLLQNSAGVMGEASLEKHHSVWVMNNFHKISRMFGVMFEGLEDRVLSLIEEIEMRYGESGSGEGPVVREKRKQGEGCCRELKRLQSSINYDYRKKINMTEGG